MKTIRSVRICCIVFLLAVAAAAFASSGRALDFSETESLPVQENGRKKPFLVFAEESLLTMSGRTSIKLDGRNAGATEIVTGIWLDPGNWDGKPLILVDHKELKNAAGLDVDRKLYSHSELAKNPALAQLFQAASIAKRTARNGRLQGLNKEAEQVGLRMAQFEALRNGSLGEQSEDLRPFRIVGNPAGSEASWHQIDRDEPRFVALRNAYAKGDQAAFDAAARDLKAALSQIAPAFQPPRWKIELERVYQHAHPFRWAWILYLAAGITLAVTAMAAKKVGYVVAWSLVGAAFCMQAFGFASRMLIAGRPPVTNMYESMVWVAFGTVLFALVFEAIYRSRCFLGGAIPVAVVSLILADCQPLALNPSIQPLVAVLQSNFWLSTHVLTITLSYAALALALGVAHIALVQVVAGRNPSAALYTYIYRAIQVGVLLLAAGTILGGVWANYSWGRFWDWDPKETWALATLLVYLFILHGRIAGAWTGFGTAVGAVLGFQSVIMAWYGVNFVLGVGLHSYGFGSGGFQYAITFVLAELALVAAAMMRRFRAGAAERRSPAMANQVPVNPAAQLQNS